MKINKKYKGIIFSCIAAILISVPIAFFMVIINVGFTKDFLKAFLNSSLVGVGISIPLANIAIPLTEKIVNKIIED
ncbi:DUF2798 domain-containing protein [Maledivibacter halophilus]|uniref:DUF2798 domain-containing protein n=1 Tax=Maledivibacter halophilus TaxID=36842 RepID=UPI002E8DCCD2|nr:DUF2798 domain-containing protein [Maledivibacter halophilus]